MSLERVGRLVVGDERRQRLVARLLEPSKAALSPALSVNSARDAVVVGLRGATDVTSASVSSAERNIAPVSPISVVCVARP